ncbi:hypothetical protein JIN85_09665 [Luteolibacter pohnpeiensis]|uniref:Uncharacterized protein n=1 Tax=Luteolibacter pohnpeiensis TaxID=454153 RepID=A0A934SB63_9BACT|nr:hypothetical protein [Luteolibacter pohnpeiensis]MBK1882684.1 hypothetical protein [Luteolibacter pohnpeiensis]
MQSFKTILLGLFSLVLLQASATADTGARVYCWAPGMSSTQLLDSYGMGTGHWLGNYDDYIIYGIAGSLTLGDQMSNAAPDASDPEKRFRSGKAEWGNMGGLITSYSAVRLRVDTESRGFYPELLELHGDRAGVTTGPVRLYGDTWHMQRAQYNQISVSIGFHLAAEYQNNEPYVNRNPNGFFYVVAERQITSTAPTGALTIANPRIYKGTTAVVGYEINRGSVGETPPFTGYSTSDEAVTVMAE